MIFPLLFLKDSPNIVKALTFLFVFDTFGACFCSLKPHKESASDV